MSLSVMSRRKKYQAEARAIPPLKQRVCARNIPDQYLDLIVELSNDTLLRVIRIMSATRPDGSPVCDSHHRARKLWRLLGHCRDMAESFIKDPGTRDYLL